MARRWLHAAALAGAALLAVACGDSDESDETAEAKDEAETEPAPLPVLAPPAPDVAKAVEPMDLPAVPEMPRPPPTASGARVPRELRLFGSTYLDTEVTVEGYVVWIYDCAASLDPGMKPAEARKVIAEQPERCLRPHVLLGDAADTPVDEAILVVEIPRELRRGDHVRVTGQWAKRSPKGFASDDGLLVYGSLEPL